MEAKDVAGRVREEIERFQDPALAGAINGLLVEPRCVEREWDYGTPASDRSRGPGQGRRSEDLIKCVDEEEDLLLHRLDRMGPGDQALCRDHSGDSRGPHAGR